MAAATKPRRAGHRTRRPDSGDLHATRAENRRYYREIDASDPHRAAYEAGRANGERPGPEEPDSVHEAFSQGYAEHEAQRNPTPQPRPSPRNPNPGGPTIVSSDMAHEGAGLLLGLVAYALAVAYLEYGWAGVTGWMSAKFLNKPTIGAKAGTRSFNYGQPAKPGTKQGMVA